MRYLLYFLVSGSLLIAVFFLLGREVSFEVKPLVSNHYLSLPALPEGEKPAVATPILPKKVQDLPNQKPLQNPPPVIKAIYATSWSAGSAKKMGYLIDLIKKTELNAIVIDIKDFSGYVTYDIKNDDVEKYKAKEIRIPLINSLIKRLHDQNIYVIARITAFQDPILAKARPDLAVKNKVTGEIWKDRKRLSWIDPAAKDAWDYLLAIAKDARGRGFDELNFDYIRFPSDGDLSIFTFPFYNPETELKSGVINNFFVYLRNHLAETKISADLFGLSTVNADDLGIGQLIENAYANFDFVSPMVYPSHYASGFLGYKNPATFPYEVVKYSLDHGLLRLTNTTNTSTPPFTAKLRPWLQDFDLGATYDAEKVALEIKAVKDAGLEDGWMLWDPNNIYTKEALQQE